MGSLTFPSIPDIFGTSTTAAGDMITWGLPVVIFLLTFAIAIGVVLLIKRKAVGATRTILGGRRSRRGRGRRR